MVLESPLEMENHVKFPYLIIIRDLSSFQSDLSIFLGILGAENLSDYLYLCCTFVLFNHIFNPYPFNNTSDHLISPFVRENKEDSSTITL